MQHLRADAGISSTLQDAAGLATDRIGQGRIAERELVVAVGVVLVLARIPASLGELPVDAGAARPGDDRQDAIEHLATGKILIEPEMHEIAEDAAALRDAETERAPDPRPPLRRERIVCRVVAQK